MAGLRPGTLTAAVVAVIATAALVACVAPRETTAAPGRVGTMATAGPSSHEVSSNVLFADYAGTQACAKCHAERVQSWLASPMHNMTRDPVLADVKGPFDGTTFRFKDDS